MSRLCGAGAHHVVRLAILTGCCGQADSPGSRCTCGVAHNIAESTHRSGEQTAHATIPSGLDRGIWILPRFRPRTTSHRSVVPSGSKSGT